MSWSSSCAATTRPTYIKRIVGLPGDRIQELKGVLHINGTPVERERVDDYSYLDCYGRERVFRQYRETLPNGVTYMTLDATPSGSLDNTQIYTVPADHYFAMGDNRDNSLDSRVPSVGFIPPENLVGRAQFIYNPQDEDARSLDDSWIRSYGEFWQFAPISMQSNNRTRMSLALPPTGANGGEYSEFDRHREIVPSRGRVGALIQVFKPFRLRPAPCPRTFGWSPPLAPRAVFCRQS